MKTLKVVDLAQQTEVIEKPRTLADGRPWFNEKTPGPTAWSMTVENERGERVEVGLTYGQFDKMRQLLKEP